MNSQIKTIAWISSLLLTAVLLAGCQSIESYYRGYTADTSSQLTLADNSTQTGRWKTFDMLLAYQTELQNNRLDISGSITLGEYYVMNTARISNLDVYLFFIDEDAKVLETARISKSLGVSPENAIHFNKTLLVPPATKAISFGYDGQVQGEGGGGDDDSGGGGGGGLDWFWKLPKKSS